MSEFDTGSSESYFTDNAPILNEISHRIEQLAANDCIRVIIDMREEPFVLHTEGGITAEDMQGMHDEVDPDVAAEMARIWQKTFGKAALFESKVFQASTATHQIYDKVEQVTCTVANGADRQGGLEELKNFQPEYAAFAEWQRAGDADTASGSEVGSRVVTLLDAVGKPYASEYAVTIEEDVVSRRVAIGYYKGAPFGVDSQVKPVEDELAKRVVQLLHGSKHLDTVALMMGGLAIEDIDAELSQVCADFQGTAQEQEFWSLLDEVRRRNQAAIESLTMAKKFGINHPAMQELINLASYLTQL